jgi:hypothetical protein
MSEMSLSKLFIQTCLHRVSQKILKFRQFNFLSMLFQSLFDDRKELFYKIVIR